MKEFPLGRQFYCKRLLSWSGKIQFSILVQCLLFPWVSLIPPTQVDCQKRRCRKGKCPRRHGSRINCAFETRRSRRKILEIVFILFGVSRRDVFVVNDDGSFIHASQTHMNGGVKFLNLNITLYSIGALSSSSAVAFQQKQSMANRATLIA